MKICAYIILILLIELRKISSEISELPFRKSLKVAISLLNNKRRVNGPEPYWSEWSKWECDKFCSSNQNYTRQVIRFRKCEKFILTENNSVFCPKYANNNVSDYEIISCDYICVKKEKHFQNEVIYETRSESENVELIIFESDIKDYNFKEFKFVWFLNGKLLEFDSFRMEFYQYDTLFKLSINYLKQSDSGVYCLYAIKTDFKISIQENDRYLVGMINLLVLPHPIHFTIFFFESVTLNCSPYSEFNDYILENDISITWYKNNEIYAQNKVFLHSVQNTGEYSCQIRDKLTKISANISVYKIESDSILFFNLNFSYLYFILVLMEIGLLVILIMFIVHYIEEQNSNFDLLNQEFLMDFNLIYQMIKE
jgi:hypothetical protein